MAKYRQLHTSFWQDGFVLDLTPEEKYFYLYLMTNSKTSQCGIYELPKRIIEIETGYNRETVQKLLQRFVDYGKIDYFEGTKELMIKNWIKYNPPNNPNAAKCVVKELSEVKNLDFSTLYVEQATEEGYALEGLTRGLQGAYKTLPSNKIINNKEEIISNKEKNIFSSDSNEYRLADYLRKYILKNNPNAKVPDDNKIQNWCKTIDLILRIDERKVEDVKEHIKYSQTDTFWMTNVLSPTSLRKQYDKLTMKIKGDATPKSKPIETEKRANAAAYQMI